MTSKGPFQPKAFYDSVIVAAPGAQQLCLDIKEETISLHEVLGSFRLSSGKYSFLTPHFLVYAVSCGEARPYLPLP